MTNNDLILPQNPTIQDFLKYERELEEVRGFTTQSIIEKCLLLGEEVGELFKAVRKNTGMKVDNENSKFGEISEELADVFILLMAVANKYNIDLEKAFREKEEINKKRNWESE